MKDHNGEEIPEVLQAIYDKYPDRKFMTADGLHEAITGVNEAGTRLVYSAEKCIEIKAALIDPELLDDDDDPYFMAKEDFLFNTEGAYMGVQTPIFLWDDGSYTDWGCGDNIYGDPIAGLKNEA